MRPLFLPWRPLALLLFIVALAAPAASEGKKNPIYPHLKGKTIRSINIRVRDVFEERDLGFPYDTANALKINTKDEVVRRELLFKEGDQFDEFVLDESERNLRSLRYLRQIAIVPKQDGDMVDILVDVQDTWTLIPQLGFSSGTGRKKTSVGVLESNLLGYGKRLELAYSEDDSREQVEGVWEDNRLFGTKTDFTAGLFDRNDGEIALVSVKKPFRSLVEEYAWAVDNYYGDTIGRLFENGDERYIYRQEKIESGVRYTIRRGDPTHEIRRFTFGYDYQSDDFTQADLDDYEDLDLDPSDVSNDISQLASDRRFTGPVLGLQYIRPDFISMNYIDRFDRVEDYNLGREYSINSFIAPKFLGSHRDSYIFSANRSQGYRFSRDSFIRGEVGYATRADEKGLSNSLARAEVKFYDVLGDKYWGENFLGKHTLAAGFFLDYGDDLDKDREFLVGGDNVIRGYKARTFTGDKRFGFNLEDRMHFIDDLYKLISIGGAVFFDAGGATNDPLGELFTDNVYSNVGFGLRFAFPRSSGGQVLRIDIAFPLRDGPDDSGQFEPRLLISGGQLFGSRLRSESFGTERASVDIGFDR
ncbi:MAG: hypothetical protein J5J00_01605 [Deltaproteobacteria bacterium]|nr:hypothetical protein [Deltaproteobacteria bacterium]